jgi:hypothetical protein
MMLNRRIITETPLIKIYSVLCDVYYSVPENVGCYPHKSSRNVNLIAVYY